MYFLKLIFKNIFRAKLRSSLTIVGLVIAIVAFGLLQTVVHAWFAGVDASSPSRLITRSSISLVFSLPVSYREKIRSVDGVKTVSLFNWFGGIYKEPKNFFAQFAVDHENFFALFPEFIFKPEELRAFQLDRQGAVVGRKLADQYGWKVGDTIPLQGTIYPGTWTFNLHGIYEGKEEATVTSQMYFHYDYINETLKKISPRRADQIGSFYVEIKDPSQVANISKSIDALFKNSLAETMTETEKSFQLNFIAQVGAIVMAIQVVSYVVIVIIMAVVANTMAMTVRERSSEYATLKALGFSPGFVAMLIAGEAFMLTMLGAVLGILLLFPIAKAFGSVVAIVFPVFKVSGETVLLQLLCATVVGTVAAIVPSWRSARIKIVDGLRHAG